MSCFGKKDAPADPQEEKRNKEIENQLKEEKKTQANKMKLLLLGMSISFMYASPGLVVGHGLARLRFFSVRGAVVTFIETLFLPLPSMSIDLVFSRLY